MTETSLSGRVLFNRVTDGMASCPNGVAERENQRSKKDKRHSLFTPSLKNLSLNHNTSHICSFWVDITERACTRA